MKKLNEIILPFFLLISFLGFSQSKIGVIKDKDGFVNIRLEKSSKSQIIGKILENEYFNFFEDNKSNWWAIESKMGLIGYVHKSRISLVKRGYFQAGQLLDINVEISIYESFLNEVSIVVFQLKPTGANFDFSCKGLIRSIKSGKLIDKIDYKEIAPVGSNYGIAFSKKQHQHDLFIASKFGDYDGEIIIVDSKGKITNFQGGDYFITNNGKYLVSDWSSDLSGLTIYDLKNKQIRSKEVLEMYLGHWYYSNGVYYAPIWDGEKEDDRTFQIDFDNFNLKKSVLKINSGEKVEMINQYCDCK